MNKLNKCALLVLENFSNNYGIMLGRAWIKTFENGEDIGRYSTTCTMFKIQELLEELESNGDYPLGASEFIDKNEDIQKFFALCESFEKEIRKVELILLDFYVKVKDEETENLQLMNYCPKCTEEHNHESRTQ